MKTKQITSIFLALIIIVLCTFAGCSRNDNSAENDNVFLDEQTDKQLEFYNVMEDQNQEAEKNYKVIEAPQMKEKELTAEKAVVETYKGEITKDDQTDKYNFTFSRDGRYRFDFSEIHNNISMEATLHDHTGEMISYSLANNKNGMTVKGLKANEKYVLKIKEYSGFSPYILSVWHQKETINITNATKVTDSVEFTDQRNVYKFTPPRDGKYRFELSEVYNGTYLEIVILNHLDETVKKISSAKNGDGITAELKMNEEYSVQVRQNKNFSSYQLHIGYQSDTIDVKPGTMVNDSISYKEQTNTYFFKNNDSKSHTVSISEMDYSCAVNLIALNHLGEEISAVRSAKNSDKIFVSEDCTIKVEQNEDVGSYTLKID